MLTYTTYSEAGGVGKTTLAANLAVAHADNGHRVLIIDMDQQDGSLSHLLGVDEHRHDPDADTIVHHMIDRPRGDFDDLIKTSEGVDIIPSHDALESLGDWLDKAADFEEAAAGEDYEYPRFEQLRRVLAENDVPNRYDVIIVDPPATAGPHLYNGIDATRSLVIPMELSGKGKQSIQGLESVVDGLEESLDISVGVLAVIPNGTKRTTDQEAYRKEVEGLGYEVPVILADRTSLMEGCWTQQCSAFKYVEEHRERRRDYESETLDQIRSLAAQLEAEANLVDQEEEVTAQ